MIHVIILLPFRMCEHIISFIDRDPIVHISIRQRQPYYVPSSIIPNVTRGKRHTISLGHRDHREICWGCVEGKDVRVVWLDKKKEKKEEVSKCRRR